MVTFAAIFVIRAPPATFRRTELSAERVRVLPEQAPERKAQRRREESRVRPFWEGREPFAIRPAVPGFHCSARGPAFEREGLYENG